MNNKYLLTKMYISNYKNVQEQMIDFSKSTIIFGDNAVGKSTLFEALILALSGWDKKVFRKLYPSSNDGIEQNTEEKIIRADVAATQENAEFSAINRKSLNPVITTICMLFESIEPDTAFNNEKRKFAIGYQVVLKNNETFKNCRDNRNTNCFIFDVDAGRPFTEEIFKCVSDQGQQMRFLKKTQREYFQDDNLSIEEYLKAHAYETKTLGKTSNQDYLWIQYAKNLDSSLLQSISKAKFAKTVFGHVFHYLYGNVGCANYENFINYLITCIRLKITNDDINTITKDLLCNLSQDDFSSEDNNGIDLFEAMSEPSLYDTYETVIADIEKEKKYNEYKNSKRKLEECLETLEIYNSKAKSLNDARVAKNKIELKDYENKIQTKQSDKEENNKMKCSLEAENCSKSDENASLRKLINQLDIGIDASLEELETTRKTKIADQAREKAIISELTAKKETFDKLYNELSGFFEQQGLDLAKNDYFISANDYNEFLAKATKDFNSLDNKSKELCVECKNSKKTVDDENKKISEVDEQIKKFEECKRNIQASLYQLTPPAQLDTSFIQDFERENYDGFLGNINKYIENLKSLNDQQSSALINLKQQQLEKTKQKNDIDNLLISLNNNDLYPYKQEDYKNIENILTENKIDFTNQIYNQINYVPGGEKYQKYLEYVLYNEKYAFYFDETNFKKLEAIRDLLPKGYEQYFICLSSVASSVPCLESLSQYIIFDANKLDEKIINYVLSITNQYKVNDFSSSTLLKNDLLIRCDIQKSNSIALGALQREEKIKQLKESSNTLAEELSQINNLIDDIDKKMAMLNNDIIITTKIINDHLPEFKYDLYSSWQSDKNKLISEIKSIEEKIKEYEFKLETYKKQLQDFNEKINLAEKFAANIIEFKGDELEKHKILLETITKSIEDTSKKIEGIRNKKQNIFDKKDEYENTIKTNEKIIEKNNQKIGSLLTQFKNITTEIEGISKVYVETKKVIEDAVIYDLAYIEKLISEYSSSTNIANYIKDEERKVKQELNRIRDVVKSYYSASSEKSTDFANAVSQPDDEADYSNLTICCRDYLKYLEKSGSEFDAYSDQISEIHRTAPKDVIESYIIRTLRNKIIKYNKAKESKRSINAAFNTTIFKGVKSYSIELQAKTAKYSKLLSLDILSKYDFSSDNKQYTKKDIINDADPEMKDISEAFDKVYQEILQKFNLTQDLEYITDKKPTPSLIKMYENELNDDENYFKTEFYEITNGYKNLVKDLMGTASTGQGDKYKYILLSAYGLNISKEALFMPLLFDEVCYSFDNKNTNNVLKEVFSIVPDNQKIFITPKREMVEKLSSLLQDDSFTINVVYRNENENYKGFACIKSEVRKGNINE